MANAAAETSKPERKEMTMKPPTFIGALSLATIILTCEPANAGFTIDVYVSGQVNAQNFTFTSQYNFDGAPGGTLSAPFSFQTSTPSATDDLLELIPSIMPVLYWWTFETASGLYELSGFDLSVTETVSFQSNKVTFLEFSTTNETMTRVGNVDEIRGDSLTLDTLASVPPGIPTWTKVSTFTPAGPGAVDFDGTIEFDNGVMAIGTGVITFLGDPNAELPSELTPPSVVFKDLEFSAVGPTKIDGTFEATVLPEPIPTVSEWGLIVMLLLALTAGTIVFARRRRPTLA